MSAGKDMAYDDLFRAVQTALQFGVDAKEFKRMLLTAWDQASDEKRRADMSELARDGS